MKLIDELISIIVPVYNCENWIARCISSIVNQSYKKIELILIDDCSTDDSYLVCQKCLEEYQGLLYNIRLLETKKNSGVSVVRNLGIVEATGQYLCFVDADDLIHSGFVQILYDLIRKNEADLAICGVKEFENDIEVDIYDKQNIQYRVGNRRDILEYGYTNKPHITSTIWARMIKKELLCGLEFPENMRFEDTAISYKILDRMVKGVIINNCLYYYFQHSDSFMNKLRDKDFIGQNIEQLAIIYDEILGYWEEKEEIEIFELAVFRHLNWLINFYYELPKSQRRKAYSVKKRFNQVYELYEKGKIKRGKWSFFIFKCVPEGYQYYRKVLSILK